MLNDRGWDVQLYLADEDGVEYGPTNLEQRDNGTYVGELTFTPDHTVRLMTGVLWIDGIRWRGPALPVPEEHFGHRQGTMILTVPGWMVDEIISVIEQVANS